MAGSGEVWKLYAGDELVAELVVTGGDFPWLDARVDARPSFEPLRPLKGQWAATQAMRGSGAVELRAR